jgi:hypothetical protein
MPNGEAMQQQIQAAISGLGPAGMKDVLQRLLAVPKALNSLLERPPPPSRRRPRRAGTVTYRRTASHACRDTKTALRRLGALTGDWRSEAPSANGVTFARAALQSWPTH